MVLRPGARQLEAAKELDPEGDKAPAIQEARAAIKAGIDARKVLPVSAKPGVGSWEKPLRKPSPIQR